MTPRHDLSPGTPERLGAFNPAEFQAGDWVAYFNNDQWQVGQLEVLASGRQPNQVLDVRQDGITAQIQGHTIDLVQPPRRFRYTPGDFIANQYVVYDLSVGPEGEIEYTLRHGQELMENVGEDVLESLTVLQDTEARIEATIIHLVGEVKRVAAQTRKPLMDSITALELKVGEMYKKIGPSGSWGESTSRDLQEMVSQVRQLAEQIRAEARALERQITELQKQSQNRVRSEAAQGVEAIYERRKKQEDTPVLGTFAHNHESWQQQKDVWDQWDRVNKEWQKWDKARQAAVKRGQAFDEVEPPQPGQQPPRPGNEPPRPRVPSDNEENRNQWYLQIYEDLNNRNQQPGQLSSRLQTFLREVDNRRHALASREGLADYQANTPEYTAVTAQIMREVITDWKSLTVESQVVDVEKEEIELQAKVAELKNKIEQIHDLDQRGNYSLQLHALEVVIENLPNVRIPNQFTAHQDAPQAMVDYWRALGRLEVDLFHYERNLEASVPTAELPEQEIDLPNDLMMEILNDRWDQMEQVMATVYREKLIVDVTETPGAEGEQPSRTRTEATTTAVKQALKSIFSVEPQLSPDTWQGLRRCGIKNWEQFRKLWETRLSDLVALGLHQMADDEVTRDSSRNMTRLGKMWAVKEHTALRIVGNVVLVGGGAALATSIFAAGGWAALAVAIGGGSIGALGRGKLGQLFDKIPGLKKHRESKAKRYKESTREKTAEKKASGRGIGLIAGLRRWIGRMTGNIVDERTKSAVDFTSNTAQAEDRRIVISSILAESIKEISGQAEAAQVLPAGSQLDAMGRKIFIAGLKRAKQEGRELTEADKLDFIRVIQELHGNGQQISQAALEQADPFWLKVIDEFLHGVGGQAMHDKSWRGAAVTTTAGGLMGYAFYASEFTRAGLGGLGGFADSVRTSKLDVAAGEARSLQARASEALRDIADWRAGRGPVAIEGSAEREQLMRTVDLFSLLLAGGGDAHQKRTLRTTRGLRLTLEKVISEARGLSRLDFVANLETLRQDRARVDEDQQKFWGRKFIELGKRFRYGGLRILRETVVGAALAVVVGELFDEFKETDTVQAARGWLHEHVGVRMAEFAGEVKEDIKLGVDKVVDSDQGSRSFPIAEGGATAEASKAVLDNFLQTKHINPNSLEAYYFKGLVEQHPSLNNQDVLEDIRQAGSDADNFIRQGGAHKMVVFKELLEHGSREEAIKFLNEQHFSQRHLGYVKGHLGSDGKLDNLVDEYQKSGGRGDIAHDLERAFQAKTNTDLANFAQKQGGNDIWARGQVRYLGASYGTDGRPTGLLFDGPGKAYVVDMDTTTPGIKQITVTTDTEFDSTIDEDEIGEFSVAPAEGEPIDPNDYRVTLTGGQDGSEVRAVINRGGITYEVPKSMLAARMGLSGGGGGGTAETSLHEAVDKLIAEGGSRTETRVVSNIYDGSKPLPAGGGGGVSETAATDHGATGNEAKVEAGQEKLAHAAAEEKQTIEQDLRELKAEWHNKEYLSRDEGKISNEFFNKIAIKQSADPSFNKIITDVQNNGSLTAAGKIAAMAEAYERTVGQLDSEEYLLVKDVKYFADHPDDFVKVNPIDDSGNEIKDSGRVIWVAKDGSGGFREVNLTNNSSQFYSQTGVTFYPDGSKIGSRE